MTFQYIDWKIHTKGRRDKETRKFIWVCKRINEERRDPYPGEWDILIDYFYPEVREDATNRTPNPT